MVETYRLSQENPLLTEEELLASSSAGSQSPALSPEEPPGNASPFDKEILLPARKQKGAGRVASVDLLRGMLIVLLAIGTTTSAWLSGGKTEAVDRIFSPAGQAFLNWQLWGGNWRSLQGIAGISLHDYLFSGFLFVAGISLTLRDRQQQRLKIRWGSRLFVMLRRVLILLMLGLFIQSAGSPVPRLVLTNPLIQIGLASLLLFPLLRVPVGGQILIAVILLGGQTAWYASAYVPEYSQSLQALELEHPQLTQELPERYGAWQRGKNIGDYTDRLWLASIPQQPDAFYRQAGKNTFNIFPALSLLLMGSITVRSLGGKKSSALWNVGKLLMAGLVMILAGSGIDQTWCPAVESLMTASWCLIAAGYSLLGLAFCVLLTGVFSLGKQPSWISSAGRNSLLMYLLVLTGGSWFSDELLKFIQAAALWIGGQQLLPVTEAILSVLLPVVCLLGLMRWLDERRVYFRC